MSKAEIQAARNWINGDTKDLYEYSSGIAELQFLINCDEEYSAAETAICTIQYSLPFYRHPYFDQSEKEKEREADKRIVRYSLYCSSIIEYMSVNYLLRSLSPQSNKNVLVNELKNKSQYKREDLLEDCSIIKDGDLRGKFRKVRNTRNEIAHSQDLEYEFKHYDNLNTYLVESREIVSHLVKKLYGERLDKIIRRLRPCYTIPNTPDVHDWTTAQLVSMYSHAYIELESTTAEEGGFVELREK